MPQKETVWNVSIHALRLSVGIAVQALPKHFGKKNFGLSEVEWQKKQI